MPGVTVHSSSSALGGYGSGHSTGTTSAYRYSDVLSVGDIKARAQKTVQREANRASPLSLIHTARTQFLTAIEKEMSGDFVGALESCIKSATLAKMTLDHSERHKGDVVLRREVNDFLQNTIQELTEKTQKLEEKLKDIESSGQSKSIDKPSSKPLGSIADRVRALQDNGLDVGTTKRNSRDVTGYSHSQHPSLQISPQPTRQANTLGITPSSSTSSTHPSHTFVSPSTLGPPSPKSSPSTSPHRDSFDFSGFEQAFPSIDALDQDPKFAIPSAPANLSTVPSKPGLKDVPNDNSSISPATPFGNIAFHIDRPSSTPITPIANVFNSRPGSPSRYNVPLKSSALATSATSSAQPKVPIPKANVVLPKNLLQYMRDYEVLLLDVRNREDFDKEHIKADAIVCMEPVVLMRDGITAEALEDSMATAPGSEATLFSNRDKFDLVVLLDKSSESFGEMSSPLSILQRVISEQAFRKWLKRMPMLLVGGLDAWKREFGDTEIVHKVDDSIDLSKSSLSGESSNFSMPLSPVPMTSQNIPLSNGYPSPGLPPLNEPQPARPFRPANGVANGDHRSMYSIDQMPSHSRMPAEVNYTGRSDSGLTRRPAMVRLGPTSPPPGSHGITPAASPSVTSPIIYPQFSSTPSIIPSGTAFVSPPDIASPPIASINPSPLSRRRNEYIDQTQEALTSYHARGPIDYPELPPQTLIRPPPVAVSSLERQDSRPRIPGVVSTLAPGSAIPPKPPRIESDFPVLYWSDTQIGISGLKNLGNTCYMNAPIQCLSATAPFARFFTENRWKNAINFTNPLGSKGRLTGAFAKLLYEMWGQDLPYLTPIEFRKSICQLRSQYDNSDQHDSQEFLSFLMDGIHEDLNRVIAKPTWASTPEQEAELERLPSQIASEREWLAWKARNDSIIVDYFQGQFRNRLECLACHKTSTTYNTFSMLQLPIPSSKNGKVHIEKCLEAFFNQEILENDDAWDCPRCKTKRRASKTLSLARLPPVLLIHLKRFEVHGRFSDKVDTFVEFPMKSLDLTRYMPAPLPPGADKSELNGGLPMSLDDPRTQLPPYRYDLYGVTNHYGNLTSGHYTAFIASRGGWYYCDDSSVRSVDPKQVVNQKAYVLFYKRVRS